MLAALAKRPNPSYRFAVRGKKGEDRVPRLLAAPLATAAVCLAAITAAPARAEVREFAASSQEVELAVLNSVPPSTPWAELLDREGGAKVQFGVTLMGPDPYSRNDGVLFSPASNTKIFTSAAALSLLGAQYRIETLLRYGLPDPSDPSIAVELELVGSGDPSWGMSEFGEGTRSRVDAMVEALAAQGVREVRGELDVRSSDARWDLIRYPEGWLPEDYGVCYGALAQAFNLRINCATLVLESTRPGLVSASWREEGVPIPVRLEVASGRETALEVVSVDAPGAVGQSYVVRGTWRPRSGPVELVLAVHDVRTWVRNLLGHSLAEHGIRHRGGSARGAPVPPATRRELKFYSPPMGELLKPFMKSSINVVGDALFKVLGQARGNAGGPDLLEAGRRVMEGFLAGVPGQDNVILNDGSGISRSNQVTTGSVMAMLLVLRGRPDFPVYWDSLPIAGVDGTLAHRMKGSAAEGILRAKTGTLRGVYNLSGFVPKLTAEGAAPEFVPFVILSKTEAANKQVARDAQDRVGAALVRAVNPGLGAVPNLLLN